MNQLTKQIITCAMRFDGVREDPRHKNSGIEIDAWHQRAGSLPGDPWCVAFVWCMVDDACALLKLKNPLPRTTSVHRLWQRSPEVWRVAAPCPGAIFLHDSGKGKGHAGFVTGIQQGAPGCLETIEGNTNPAGSREGDGVYWRTRSFDYANLGYLDVSVAFGFPEVVAE